MVGTDSFDEAPVGLEDVLCLPQHLHLPHEEWLDTRVALQARAQIHNLSIHTIGSLSCVWVRVAGRALHDCQP